MKGEEKLADSESAVMLATAARSAKDFVEVWVANGKTHIRMCGLQEPTRDRWRSFGWDAE